MSATTDQHSSTGLPLPESKHQRSKSSVVPTESAAHFSAAAAPPLPSSTKSRKTRSPVSKSASAADAQDGGRPSSAAKGVTTPSEAALRHLPAVSAPAPLSAAARRQLTGERHVAASATVEGVPIADAAVIGGRTPSSNVMRSAVLHSTLGSTTGFSHSEQGAQSSDDPNRQQAASALSQSSRLSPPCSTLLYHHHTAPSVSFVPTNVVQCNLERATPVGASRWGAPPSPAVTGTSVGGKVSRATHTLTPGSLNASRGINDSLIATPVRTAMPGRLHAAASSAATLQPSRGHTLATPSLGQASVVQRSFQNQSASAGHAKGVAPISSRRHACPTCLCNSCIEFAMPSATQSIYHHHPTVHTTIIPSSYSARDLDDSMARYAQCHRRVMTEPVRGETLTRQEVLRGSSGMDDDLRYEVQKVALHEGSSGLMAARTHSGPSDGIRRSVTSSVLGHGRASSHVVSSRVLEETYLTDVPDDEQTFVVEVPTIIETVKRVPTKYKQEIHRHATEPSVHYIERIVSKPENRYVDRVIEVPQIQEKIRTIPVKKVIEVPKEIIRYVPKIEEKVVTKEVTVPGDIIEVPKPYLIERNVVVPRYIDEEVAAVVSQNFQPIISESSDDFMEVPVRRFNPYLVPVNVYVPKPVSRHLIAKNRKDFCRVVRVPPGHWDSLLREMNPALAAEPDLAQLAMVKQRPPQQIATAPNIANSNVEKLVRQRQK